MALPGRGADGRPRPLLTQLCPETASQGPGPGLDGGGWGLSCCSRPAAPGSPVPGPSVPRAFREEVWWGRSTGGWEGLSQCSRPAASEGLGTIFPSIALPWNTERVLRPRRPGEMAGQAGGAHRAHASPWGSTGFFLSFHIAHIPHLRPGKPPCPWQYQCQGDSWGADSR